MLNTSIPPEVVVSMFSVSERNPMPRADWIARAKETTRENARRRAEYQKLADMMGVPYDSSKADEVTRETLGKEADTLIAKKPAPPKRSTLAERAARGPKPAAEGQIGRATV